MVIVVEAAFSPTLSCFGVASVLVWIHGGDYTVLSKDAFLFTPEGLYNVFQSDFVVVSINYVGFLAGSSVREECILNSGLLDPRFALDWAKLHLAKFGGEPLGVTIMGESAGGGSVVHHISAYSGGRGVPFNQAVLQSPSWFPGLTPEIQDGNTALFLRYLNVTTLEEARSTSTNDLIRANLLLIGTATPYPSYPVGPVPDDSFIPDSPAELVASSRYAHGLHILTGHNFDEGLIITNPTVIDDASYIQWMRDIFPSATGSSIDELLVQYPSTFNGSIPYNSQITRAALTIGDLTINRFVSTIASAKHHEASFGYVVNAYHSLRGQDLPIRSTHQTVWQRLSSFILTGTPDFGHISLAHYGENGYILYISNHSLVVGVDPAFNSRCAWVC
ncbi:Alpha/Beta hydrolase protein [Flagelloscypha sp. PMI_526]|nr:Alpha/Beta hydrolase protein [Flagelloscypha sp. PMI_526]